MSGTKALLRQALSLLERLEDRLPPAPPSPDWDCVAQRWRREGQRGWLQGVKRPHGIRLDDLKCMDRQKAEIDRNTRQFVQGRPANNVLLWGSRGTGKSSLIKALVNQYATLGLRLIEVEKEHLVDLPDIVEWLEGRTERFLLYCDDLSFEANDASYKSLKAILDGSVAAAPDNVLIYATSNRRHLLPEFQRENLEARMVDEEIHHGEGVEEKISLSERFGLWLSFYPFRQEQYLEIVGHWLRRLEVRPPCPEEMRQEALKWALARGSRSGRVAWQFARDWAGRHG